MCSLWLLFLKPQRTQRRYSLKAVLFKFFSGLSVVTFFETTENTKAESHQARSISIFSLCFVVTIFETTEGTKAELHQTRLMSIFLGALCGYLFRNHRGPLGIASSRIYLNNFLCALLTRARLQSSPEGGERVR